MHLNPLDDFVLRLAPVNRLIVCHLNISAPHYIALVEAPKNIDQGIPFHFEYQEKATVETYITELDLFIDAVLCYQIGLVLSDSDKPDTCKNSPNQN